MRRWQLSVAVILALVLVLTVLNYLPVASRVPHANGSLEPGPAQPIYLHLAHQSFDPLTYQPDAAHLPFKPAGQGDGYYIIQFNGIIQLNQKEQVTALGATLLGYVPDFAFVARMNDAIAETIRALLYVRWVGLYQPAYRIEPSLARQHISAAQAETLTLLVTFFPGQDIASTIRQLEGWDARVLRFAHDDRWGSRIELAVRAARLADLANLPGVEWIEHAPAFLPTNDRAADVIGVRPVWDNHGMYGAGQVVAVCDTGLDQGLIDPAHLHDDFEDGAGGSRVVTITDIAGDGIFSDTLWHGTHVAGSVLGNGARSGSSPLSHTFPSTSVVGMAPEAQLYFQSCGYGPSSGWISTPINLADLFNPAYQGGARIHTNSWGDDVGGGHYDAATQSADQFLWDHPDMTVLFAAGNSGVDADADGVIDQGNVIVPATAKNIISVGASENHRADLTRAWGPDERFPADPIASDRRADAPWGLAAFSSRGYTLDGRVKPDIVAPGTYISSTKSVFYTAVAGDYMYAQGTSMAAPLVAGAAALVREFLTRTMQIEPSAALVKAILANGATDLYPGQYGPADSITQEIKLTRPSPQAGWGRLNLEASLFPVDPRRTRYWDTSHDYTSSLNLLSTGQTATYTFELTSSAPVSITLAWTDYPGAPAANGALVNDLDLQVTGPLTTYTPSHPGQRGPTHYLYHDDWIPDAYSTGGAIGAQYAVRFTPQDYPAKLDQALFYLYKPSGGGPITFTAKVYDDNGADGGPGNVVYTTTALARLQLAGPGYALWHPVNLSAAPVISAGSFYVAMEYTVADNPSLGLDTTAPINQQSWKFDGITWTQVLTNNMMIHAVVKDADHVTLADRVNNIEGIDIADPTPGVYTLAVSGYHVPFGPQPYALVVSGMGRLLGSETFTRAIRAPGRYTFGNTGAKIEVASAGADIGVSVQRDAFPTIFQTNSVARTYLITASDISAGQLSLGYEPAEMPEGLEESTLGLFRWNGAALTPYSSVVDVNAHVVTASVTDVSSRWAIAGAGGPAPHTLYLPLVLR